MLGSCPLRQVEEQDYNSCSFLKLVIDSVEGLPREKNVKFKHFVSKPDINAASELIQAPAQGEPIKSR